MYTVLIFIIYIKVACKFSESMVMDPFVPPTWKMVYSGNNVMFQII